jgi:hypothetical protein
MLGGERLPRLRVDLIVERVYEVWWTLHRVPLVIWPVPVG